MKKLIDTLTPRGKKAVEWGRRAVRGFLTLYPNYTWQETAVDRYADVDGLLGCASNGHQIIQCVLETKSRPTMTTNQLFGEYEGRWLISHSKLIRGYDVAWGLRSHFICLLVLPKEKIAYMRKIAHFNKDIGGLEWVADFEVHETETPKTINGGSVIRKNAFIDMYSAKKFNI